MTDHRPWVDKTESFRFMIWILVGFLWSYVLYSWTDYYFQALLLLVCVIASAEAFNLFEFLERKFNNVRPVYQPPPPQKRVQQYRRPPGKISDKWCKIQNTLKSQRGFQSVVFNSCQKMTLRALYVVLCSQIMWSVME